MYIKKKKKNSYNEKNPFFCLSHRLYDLKKDMLAKNVFSKREKKGFPKKK